MTAKPNEKGYTCDSGRTCTARIFSGYGIPPSPCLLSCFTKGRRKGGKGERESVFIIFIYLLVGWLVGAVVGKLADALGGKSRVYRGAGMI